MPVKREVIDSVLDRNYTGVEVKHLINTVKTTVDGNISVSPSQVKQGDVFIAQGGTKRRPYVVISVRKKEGIAIAVPLTTTNDELALTPYTSRFLREGWFTNQLMSVKLSFVIENFGGIMENRTAIRQFKKDIKQFYRGLI